jgi:hypothetical protein
MHYHSLPMIGTGGMGSLHFNGEGTREKIFQIWITTRPSLARGFAYYIAVA